ncbi:MmcQ/YjbR family DNA-binding protein [Gordonia sp. CPCC 206044]|uniref:MmcQ/YjbR family DNA-binding protein n=1 Tax=Gordonia sp. CPCC 206044 TaxID=3140793 RepID=UPI003AF3F471
MAHPIMFDDADPLLGRVRQIALALPDATEVIAHGRPTFRCGKMFGNYGGSVKGGERRDHSILFIPDESERQALVEDPRFFLPAYLGPYGWLGLALDGSTDWAEVAELLDASFRQVAPKRSMARLPSPGASTE